MHFILPSTMVYMYVHAYRWKPNDHAEPTKVER